MLLARDQLGRSSAGSSIEAANGCHSTRVLSKLSCFKIITFLLLLDVLVLTWRKTNTEWRINRTVELKKITIGSWQGGQVHR